MAAVLQIETSWAAWLAALEGKGVAAAFLARPGANEEQLVELEALVGARLPVDVRALYRLADGQHNICAVRDRPKGRLLAPLFGGYEFNSLERIAFHWGGWRDLREQSAPEQLEADFDDSVEVRAGHPVRKLYTHAAWIPFATDGGGNSLAIDLDPTPGGTRGQVIVIGPDEDIRRVLAPSVAEFIAALTPLLEVGRLTIGAPGDDAVVLFAIEPGMLQ